MNSRINKNWKAPEEISCPVKEEYELVTILEPISFNEDKSIKEYKEIHKYKVHKSKWQDFIDSFDLGSPSEQIMNHLVKGTPLITAHTLPPGDYTPKSFLKGAEIVREMQAKGITLEMIVDALNSSKEDTSSESGSAEGGSNNGSN